MLTNITKKIHQRFRSRRLDERDRYYEKLITQLRLTRKYSEYYLRDLEKALRQSGYYETHLEKELD